jgi:hypothetical protein
VRPLDCNRDAGGQVPFVTATALIKPPLPLPRRHPTPARQAPKIPPGFEPLWLPYPPGSSSSISAPGGYLGCTTCDPSGASGHVAPPELPCAGRQVLEPK